VLRARLADARFFWSRTARCGWKTGSRPLKDRVYYEKLGSVFDKVERIDGWRVFLTERLHPTVTPAQAGVQGNRSGPRPWIPLSRNDDAELGRLAQRAAHLAKADLSTAMVGEFPELQGVIGRYYALNDGEDPRVAHAIAEHYKPLGPE